MADHIQEVHGGAWNREKPWEEWDFSLSGGYKKPLERQLSEFSAIRRAKTQGKAKFNGKDLEVDTVIHNTKDEWFSHTSHWDVVD